LLSQHELRALWESGVPLDRAWLEFTPDNFDAFMLRVLQTYPANDDMFEHASDEAVRKRYAQLKGWLPMDPEGRQTKLRIKIDVQRSYLLDNLYDGDLWAIGFRTLPDGFDELARVPRHLFFTDYEQERDVRPDVYWAKAEVRADDGAYFQIRVIRSPELPPQAVREKHAENTQDSSRPKKLGRPSTADKISTLVAELLTTDLAFQAMPNRQTQAAEVRARLRGESARYEHDMVGYRTSVIVRIIGEVAGRLTRSE
jgi:hypothetical protein